MAWTTVQLQAIEDAIASGELTVRYDGKEVTYRSMSDLLKARDVIRAQLIADGVISSTATTVSYAAFDKG